jgi:hypothetical protein
MAKHRFPIRVRAAREGIRSSRRLAITGAVILAMGAAGAGIAMASPGGGNGNGGGGGGGNGSATISASTSVSSHPDTTSAGAGTACTSSSNGPVWALDSYTSTLAALPDGTNTWKVTIQDKGSFAGFADPNTCNALKSKGSLVGLYTVTVTSANTPDPSNLQSSYSGDVSTTQMVRDFFNDPGATVAGGDYFFVYQGGNYVQTTSSLYGDVVASH